MQRLGRAIGRITEQKMSKMPRQSELKTEDTKSYTRKSTTKLYSKASYWISRVQARNNANIARNDYEKKTFPILCEEKRK